MKTILIIGINGYLGSNLAIRFNERFNIIGIEYNTKNLYRIKKFGFKVYSVDEIKLKNIFKTHDIDYVIHAATFYGREGEEDQLLINSNFVIPHLILENSLIDKSITFINTDTILNKLTSPYSLTKKHFLEWLKFYSNANKIKVVNLTMEHFYGPGTSDTNFITNLTKKMLKNVSEINLTKAEQKRDFLFIEDLLKVFDIILGSHFKLNENFIQINVASGKSICLKDIIECLRLKTKTKTKLIYGSIPYRNGEIMNSKLNIQKLKKFGWVPSVNIDEGLQMVVNYENNILNEK